MGKDIEDAFMAKLPGAVLGQVRACADAQQYFFTALRFVFFLLIREHYTPYDQ
jgi:hypothetical protein